MIRKGWDWIKRHKGKAIALSTIVAVGAVAAAYFAYSTSSSDGSDAPQGSEDNENDGSSSLGGGGVDVDGGNSSVTNSSSNSSSNNDSGVDDVGGGDGGKDKSDKAGGARVIRDGKGSENKVNSSGSSGGSTNSSSSSKVAAKPDGMFPDISLVERTKWRLKARKQFDSIICPFLGILVVKINDTLNTKSIVTEIKQIKASLNSRGGGESSEGSDEEEEDSDEQQLIQIETLWDHLKVSSISILIANAFLSSTLAVLIQIQMYIISKYAYFLSQHSSSGGGGGSSIKNNGNNIGASRDAADEGLGDEAIRILMECTYGHFLKSGLETAINIINQHVASCFSDWSINTSLEVEFSDLRHSILLVKKSLEGHFDSFLKVILQNKSSSPMGIPESGIGSNPKVLLINKIMNQTWEIIDSPLFVAAVKEATDIYFQLFFDQLKKSAFIKDEKMDSTLSNLKKIPLASLLSRIQSISTNMIPTDTASTSSTSRGSSHNSNVNSNLLVLKDIMSGPILDSLCISVFEASTPIE